MTGLPPAGPALPNPDRQRAEGALVYFSREAETVTILPCQIMTRPEAKDNAAP